MSERPSSVNRWEPTSDVAHVAATSEKSPPAAEPPAPRRTRRVSGRVRVAAGALVVFLGAGAGGYVVGHGTSAAGRSPGAGFHQGPGPGTEVPDDGPGDGFGAGPGDRRNDGFSENGSSQSSDSGQPSGVAG